MTESRKSFLDRLFKDQGSAVRSFLRGRVSLQSDAEELAQEVYLRMLRVADPSTIRNPEAYLFTVAGNLVKEHYAKERAAGRSVDIEDGAIEDQLAELPNFAQQCDTEARFKRLRVVLAQLPIKCQAAVALHYWRGMSYEEIAEQLGVSPDMVKKHIRNALAHCRRRMASLG